MGGRVTEKQSGLTLVELMIGIGVFTTVIVIALTQLVNINSFFASITAEVSSKSEVSQASELFKRYFQTKWRGGFFECQASPRIGLDSYCVVSTDCVSYAANSYGKCKSMAIIRGDPADLTTSPDRVRITTRCVDSQAYTQSSLKFENSICGLSCAVGKFPSTSIEITKASGATTLMSFPGGTDPSVKRAVTSTSETRGFELCLSKSPGSPVVTLEVQSYYLLGGTLKNVQRQVSMPELTSSNPNIEFLP